VHQTLIVAKMDPANTDAVARIFAESDATDLPEMIGVRRRTLFAFNDLYLHLVQADEDIYPTLSRARSHPLYGRINKQLSEFISPYDPNWREPKDAMASPFYEWTPSAARSQ
jgi:cyclase